MATALPPSPADLDIHKTEHVPFSGTPGFVSLPSTSSATGTKVKRECVLRVCFLEQFNIILLYLHDKPLASFSMTAVCKHVK